MSENWNLLFVNPNIEKVIPEMAPDTEFLGSGFTFKSLGHSQLSLFLLEGHS